MMKWQHFLTIFAFALCGVTTAQTPNDVLNPTDDGIARANEEGADVLGLPTLEALLEDITVRQEDRLTFDDFRFDQLLDPSNGTNAASLTAGARSIIRNHLFAQRQVQLAIDFLEGNRNAILKGDSSAFNQVFGNIGRQKEVAILAPFAISGLWDNNGPRTLEADDDTNPAARAQLRAGDWIFIGDLSSPGIPATGFVVRVERIETADDNGNQMIFLDASTPGITMNLMAATKIYKVLKFELRTDPARFDQVLRTFQALRDTLSGFDEDQGRDLQPIRNQLYYQRGFQAFVDEKSGTNTGLWAPGLGEFTSLSPFFARGVADRMLRQNGFSNSDSHYKLDRDEDIRKNTQFTRTDRFGDDVFFGAGANSPDFSRALPLLWTEDNELPEFFENRGKFGNDEDRPFFRDRQTIFGSPDFSKQTGMFEMFVARAFFEESINHDADFLDTTTAIDDLLAQGIRRCREASGQLNPLNCDSPTFSTTLLLDLDFRHESGEATKGSTEFRRWQMIIEAFGENSTTFDDNSTAIGLLALGGGESLAANDSGSYARFADLIGGTRTGGSGINRRRIEPRGKRAQAGFNPIVPRR